MGDKSQAEKITINELIGLGCTALKGCNSFSDITVDQFLDLIHTMGNLIDCECFSVVNPAVFHSSPEFKASAAYQIELCKEYAYALMKLGLETEITFDMLKYATHKTKSIVLNFLLKLCHKTLNETGYDDSDFLVSDEYYSSESIDNMSKYKIMQNLKNIQSLDLNVVNYTDSQTLIKNHMFSHNNKKLNNILANHDKNLMLNRESMLAVEKRLVVNKSSPVKIEFYEKGVNQIGNIKLPETSDRLIIDKESTQASEEITDQKPKITDKPKIADKPVKIKIDSEPAYKPQGGTNTNVANSLLAYTVGNQANLTHVYGYTPEHQNQICRAEFIQKVCNAVLHQTTIDYEKSLDTPASEYYLNQDSLKFNDLARQATRCRILSKKVIQLENKSMSQLQHLEFTDNEQFDQVLLEEFMMVTNKNIADVEKKVKSCTESSLINLLLSSKKSYDDQYGNTKNAYDLAANIYENAIVEKNVLSVRLDHLKMMVDKQLEEFRKNSNAFLDSEDKRKYEKLKNKQQSHIEELTEKGTRKFYTDSMLQTMSSIDKQIMIIISVLKDSQDIQSALEKNRKLISNICEPVSTVIFKKASVCPTAREAYKDLCEIGTGYKNIVKDLNDLSNLLRLETCKTENYILLLDQYLKDKVGKMIRNLVEVKDDNAKLQEKLNIK